MRQADSGALMVCTRAITIKKGVGQVIALTKKHLIVFLVILLGYFRESTRHLSRIPGHILEFQYAMKFIHRKASSPPLGLLTIAAMLSEAWEKRLVDMNVESMHDAKQWSNLWKLHRKHSQVPVRRHHFETSFIW